MMTSAHLKSSTRVRHCEKRSDEAIQLLIQLARRAIRFSQDSKVYSAYSPLRQER